MRFPDDAPVTPAKLTALRERIQSLAIALDQVEAHFIRASGPGGQKVNKTSSGVWLSYPPLGVQVKWTRERSQALNRFLALRELVDEIERVQRPGHNPIDDAARRVRRQKDRRRRRARQA